MFDNGGISRDNEPDGLSSLFLARAYLHLLTLRPKEIHGSA
jgi:hypothetical protein